MSEFKCSLCRREIAVHQREHGINWYSCLNSKCALRHYLFGREAIEALCNHMPEPGQPAAVKTKRAKFPLQKDLTNIRALIVADELSKEQALWMLDEIVALQSNIGQRAAGQSEPVAWMTPDGRVASAKTKAALPPACREELSIPLDVRTIPAAPAVQKDWKLVPIEPTEKMIEAGTNAALSVPENDSHPVGGWSQYGICCYAAMLAASPEQQGGAGQANAAMEARGSTE